jgi:uncharacterized protein (TIGR02996 family)
MALSSPLDGAPIDPEMRSFFRAIKENPDDDTPRLIFADWLQERGDAATSARGEFLRLNVLRHRLSYDDPHHDVLKRREAEIITQYQWAWLGPLPDAAPWNYERGMIQLTARAEKILTTEIAGWARSDAALWIDQLALTNVVVAHKHVIQLACSPLLDYLNRLDLSNNHLRNISYLLGQDRVLPFLTELVLSRNRLTLENIACLARRHPFRHLTLLDLQGNRLGDEAARLLAKSPHLQNLAKLRLGGNRFTVEAIALLRQEFGERVHF